jgi:hypothetical protein
MKSILVTAALIVAVCLNAFTNVVLAGAVPTASTEATNGASLLNPCYQPLPDGAGPQTNDVSSKRILKKDIPSFTKVRAEDSKLAKEELADLWDAALVNSQDVRFIVERMAPKRENIKSGGMIKDLSQAMYGCIVAGEGVAKGMSASGKQSAGAQLIVGVLSQHQSKDEKKAAVSENDAIILYKMIRDLAGKLTSNYYNYRKYMNAIERANVDLGDLTAMVSEARGKVDQSAFLELEYLLRKAQRDIDTMEFKMASCRKELVTLCGGPAMDKVDVMLAEEVTNDSAPHLVTGPERSDQVAPDDSDQPGAEKSMDAPATNAEQDRGEEVAGKNESAM